MKRRLLSAAVTWVCLGLCCTHAYGVAITFERFKQHRMENLRTDDSNLRSIYENQLEERYTADVIDMDARDSLFNSRRSTAEAQYVLEALEAAYAQEPKDWGTIAVALEIAVVGIDQARIVEISSEILENVRDIPDDCSDVIWGASQYLLVKRGFEFVDLVVKCVYADVVGVQDEMSPKLPGEDKQNRNHFRRKAISALREYLPLEKKMKVFEQLSNAHPVEAAEPRTWGYSIANELRTTRIATENMLQGDDRRVR